MTYVLHWGPGGSRRPWYWTGSFIADPPQPLVSQAPSKAHRFATREAAAAALKAHDCLSGFLVAECELERPPSLPPGPAASVAGDSGLRAGHPPQPSGRGGPPVPGRRPARASTRRTE